MILVADFGGSNARAALAWREESGIVLERLRVEPLPEDRHPAEWLRAYYLAQGRPALRNVVACAAGPLLAEADGLRRIRFTHRRKDGQPIELDTRQLAQAGSSRKALLLNDFEAVAHCLPALAVADLRPHGGITGGAGTRLALGAGTGLGVAAWLPGGGGVVAAGEGGHIRLAPGNAREAALLARLADTEGFVSAEHLLSGPGLLRLHRVLSVEAGQPPECADAAAVWQQWLAGNVIARNAVALFTTLLGRYAGDLALAFGATGGVYLAGGIVPGWGEHFDTARFREGFEAKGDFRSYVAAIPSFTVLHPQPALLGMATHALAGAKKKAAR
jgi:glucokinase